MRLPRTVAAATAAMVSVGIAWGGPASPGAIAAGGCPHAPAPAPNRSSAPLPVGFSVIAQEGLANPYFRAMRPPSKTPMPVHFYVGYDDAKLPIRIAAIRAYHADGYATLLTIHANAAVGGVLTPSAYSAYVNRVLGQAGPALDSVEITNEGNVPSPSTSDGNNPLLIPDLIAGVEAAHQFAAAHREHLRVGFNWVFDSHTDLNGFWAQLKLEATPEFLSSVDFLGLHTYPNPLSAPTPVDDSINAAEIDGLQTARCEMGDLGLSPRIPIEVTEVGYPVPNAGYLGAQADYWRRVLDTIHAYRANFGVDAVYVFRFPADSSTASADFGIVDAQGRPRPAYAVIRSRITTFDPAQPAKGTHRRRSARQHRRRRHHQ